MYRYKHYNTYKNVHKKQEVSERKDHYGEVQKNMIRRQKRTEKVLWARPDIGIPASGILEGGGQLPDPTAVHPLKQSSGFW